MTVVRNMLSERFQIFLKSFLKKMWNSHKMKECNQKIKLKKYNIRQLYLGTLVLALYCYFGDNVK